MPNALYDFGRENFLSGQINWLTDNIKVSLIDTDDYTIDLQNHEFFSSIPSAAIIATATLENKTSDAGIADADDILFTSVVGDVAEALVIWKDTGLSTTSPLIAYMDAASGLPIVPNGGDITIQWDNGTNRIFKL